MAVYPTVKLEHLLVVWVHTESCSAVPQGTQDIANVLMECCPQVEKVEVRLECDCLR